MNFIKRISSCFCRFVDFPFFIKVDFQLYKFDAFSIEDNGQPVDLTVSFRSELETDPKPSFYTEVFGKLWTCYTWRIYKGVQGQYRWELTDNFPPQEKVAIFSMPDPVTPENCQLPQELHLWYDPKKITTGMLLEAFDYPFQYYFNCRGGLIFHCSLVEYHGRGILVAAPSGTGKTTFSRRFRDEAGALILCGDRGYCVQEPDGWMAYGAPWCGTSGECINRKVPVHAVLLLEQAEENRIYPLEDMEAWTALYENILFTSIDEQVMQCGLDRMEAFLEEIPVYRLCCTKGPDPVHLVMEALEL